MSDLLLLGFGALLVLGALGLVALFARLAEERP